MNQVDLLRRLKVQILEKIKSKNSWGKNELEDVITEEYMKVLEMIIDGDKG